MSRRFRSSQRSTVFTIPLVSEWKRALVDGAAAVFERGPGRSEKKAEVLTDELYKQIGQQKVQIDFLARALGK